MANVLPHLALRVGGGLYNSTNRWSIGLKFRSVTGGDPGALDGMQAKLESWRDAIRALYQGNIIIDDLRRAMGASTDLDQVRCSSVGADGREDAVALLDLSQPIAGIGTASLPSQMCVAISLRTGRPGGSYRGRVYWPATGLSPSGGDISPADAGNVSAGFANWLKAVENAGASILNPGIAACVVSTTKAVATPITSVAVGSRFDIQRRRAQSEQESYSVTSVAQ